MFMRLQNTMAGSHIYRINISTAIQDKLRILQKLLAGPETSLAHIRKMIPYPPTWITTKNVPGTGMGGVCLNLPKKCFICRNAFQHPTQIFLVLFANPNGDITVNDLKLCSFLSHLGLFAPRMDPLSHICMQVDNTSVEGLSRRGSVRST